MAQGRNNLIFFIRSGIFQISLGILISEIVHLRAAIVTESADLRQMDWIIIEVESGEGEDNCC